MPEVEAEMTTVTVTIRTAIKIVKARKAGIPRWKHGGSGTMQHIFSEKRPIEPGIVKLSFKKTGKGSGSKRRLNRPQ